MLHGKLVFLRAIEKEDLEQVREWMTDPDLLHLLGARPMPLATIEQEKLADMFRLRDGRVLAVLSRDKVLVGLIAFGNFHEFNRTAQLVLVIGDRSEWNRGYGSDALRTVIRFAFEDLNLNCLEVQVPDFNARALRCFEKVGFEQEGKLRSRLFLRGRYWDLVVASVQRDSWNGTTAVASEPAGAAQPTPSVPVSTAGVPIGRARQGEPSSGQSTPDVSARPGTA